MPACRQLQIHSGKSHVTVYAALSLLYPYGAGVARRPGMKRLPWACHFQARTRTLLYRQPAFRKLAIDALVCLDGWRERILVGFFNGFAAGSFQGLVQLG